ncbi:MAG TPA: GNAT family N-acetyltransferase [Planctomycetota bacterium]|nr:GNAT family N-acetyltransferase [Planctomycetota bacterium]
MKNGRAVSIISDMSSPQVAQDLAAFEIHACGPSDRAEQVRLFNACFKKAIDIAGLVWRYDENPVGAAISLLARPAGKDGVSGYACNPRLATTRGESAAVIGETGDVMTHPDWRKRGIFSELDRAAMARAKEQGWPLVFGLPNRRSAHIFLELGWERVGTLRPFTCVLADVAAARSERAKEGRLAGWTTGFALRRSRRARARASVIAAGHVLRAIEQGFPAATDELSRTVEKRFAFMVRRDKAYLDWRFLSGPARLHRAFEVRDAAGAFAGYCVVQLPRPGSVVGFLVDVLARDDAAFAAAIQGGIEALEQGGAALVQATAIDGSWWEAQLRAHGFLAPKRENFLTIILHVHDAAHPLAAAARDPRSWYFTDGDRDDETMG